MYNLNGSQEPGRIPDRIVISTAEPIPLPEVFCPGYNFVRLNQTRKSKQSFPVSRIVFDNLARSWQNISRRGYFISSYSVREGYLIDRIINGGGTTVMTDKRTGVPGYMQNRELSWLSFNERVLLEANRRESPLLERLKYISIFTSNLDEFYMVRVGSLTDMALFNDENADNKTGMTPLEQLDKVFLATKPLYELREQAYASVISGLGKHGVHFLSMQDLSADETEELKEYFTFDIMPLLSPQIIDSRHPFPHISNKQLHIAVLMNRKKGPLFGLIAVPKSMDRMIRLKGEGFRFVLLEDLILHFAGLVFNVYEVAHKSIIAVTRNADLDTEQELLDEDIDHRAYMKDMLKKRQRLSPVRLETSRPFSNEVVQYFCEKLELAESQVFDSSVPLDLSFSYSLNHLLDADTVKRLVWPVHIPAETFPTGRNVNMMKTVRERDILLSYPYESMSPFLSMMRQASGDISVLCIKITLYRIDAQSRLAEYLIDAAENGKEVIVLMELRARFDESNNIEWAQRLEEAGCRVIYGLVGYKVHSKVCLITFKESGKIRYITQIGTGNYNGKTARLYTDIALITYNQEIGRDAANFFSNMLIGNLDGQYNILWVAPNSLKNNVLGSIEKEREKALRGEEARIVIKCNSLTDKEIIEALATASADGVQILMIIRGICCMLPGVPGATGNIHAISIVGKFLEHSRIFCFGSGDKKEIYIASSDLMTRNTQRRVEIACPILDAGLRERISDMFDVMLSDNTQAWELFPDGNYIQRKHGVSPAFNSQEILIREAIAGALHSEASNSGVQSDSCKLSIGKSLLRFLSSVFPKQEF